MNIEHIGKVLPSNFQRDQLCEVHYTRLLYKYQKSIMHTVTVQSFMVPCSRVFFGEVNLPRWIWKSSAWTIILNSSHVQKKKNDNKNGQLLGLFRTHACLFPSHSTAYLKLCLPVRGKPFAEVQLRACCLPLFV